MQRRLCLVFAVVACVSVATWSQHAVAMEGNAAAWGARDPGRCTPIRLKAAPSRQQVAAMVRCKHELINSGSGELWLMENLTVTIGARTPFAAMYNTFVMEHADVRSAVYPIRGSFTRSICKSRADAAIYGNPDLNCYETDVPSASGVCWKTSFGDWRCLLNGASAGRREPTSPPRPVPAAAKAAKR
jgi:hypothetical protein